MDRKVILKRFIIIIYGSLALKVSDFVKHVLRMDGTQCDNAVVVCDKAIVEPHDSKGRLDEQI